MVNETNDKSLPQLILELRSYQAELETQNEALRYSRIAAEGASERFESLFSKVPLALMVVDEYGMVVQSNSMALSLFRPLENDPPLNFLLPLVDAAHVSRVESTFASARGLGASEAKEVVFSRGSQGFFTGDLHIAKIDYSQDELAHFICAIVDQSPLLAERKALRESANALTQRNAELHQSENRLAAIINSSLDAIICVDEAQTITVFNPAAAALFRCPANSALGTKLVRFLPNSVSDIAATLPATHAVLGETQGCTADQDPLSLEVSVSCERHAQGNITTVFARDLTERKAMETQRIHLESQLRESHKMQAVGTMAGGIAHDFNNILAAILGNVALARQDVAVNATAQVSLVEIEKAGRRARDLVRQILTFSRNESTRRVPVRLADVVQETVRLLQVTLPPQIQIQVAAESKSLWIEADPTQVEQALLNLSTNALQSMASNAGTVWIETDSVHLDDAESSKLSLPPGPYNTLRVRDNGTGMSAQTLERIFEPFFTTKEVGQGTGLGLAVVHGVMRTHLGGIDVSSTQGQGSVFTLYFPALVGANENAPISLEPERLEKKQGEGKHVLYLDDDPALVFLIQRALTRRGFKVTSFTDPQLAMQTLQDAPLEFDLVVTDHNMPGYSGIDVLNMVRSIRPDLPVALASGYVTPAIEQAALNAGARTLIHKPNDVDEMCDTLQSLLQDAAISQGTRRLE